MEKQSLYAEVQPPELIDRIGRSASYLAKQCQANGRFVYSYNARSGTERPGYNIVRHAGTTMELLRAIIVCRDPAIKTAALTALQYLQESTKASSPDGSTACVVEGDYAKLGATALTILSIDRLRSLRPLFRSEQRMEERLARHLVNQQRENGQFVCKVSVPDGQPFPLLSAYYPGEACLALCRLARVHGNDTYLGHSMRGLSYLLNLRRSSESNAPFADHWLVKAIDEFDALAPDSKWFWAATKLTESLINGWSDEGVCAMSTTAIATRLECLVAWLSMARRHGDRAVTMRVKAIVAQGLRECFNRQVDAESASLPYPAAYGGFLSRRGGFTIRIDTIQHVLGAALGWLDERAVGSDNAADLESCCSVDWSPERQVIQYYGDRYEHEGPTRTDPSHDLAHLLVAATTSLPWRPSGTPDEIRLAEYNAVFVEHLLHGVYAKVVTVSPASSIDWEEVLFDTLKYARWFVEEQFTPFPLPAEEAYRRFSAGIDWEALTRLAPFFFRLKYDERAEADYRQLRWTLSFHHDESPRNDDQVAKCQAVLEAVTRYLLAPTESSKLTLSIV